MPYTLHPDRQPAIARPHAPVAPMSALSALAVFVAGAFAAGLALAGRDRRGRWFAVGLAVAALTLGASGALAASGMLADVDARPPPVGVLLIALTMGTVALAVSRVGDQLLGVGLAVLVGAQSFRIAAEAGVVPVEVTWHELNLDVVTGLTAAALGAWLWRGSPPRAVVWVWNAAGLALLAAVSALSVFGVLPTAPRMTLPTSWPGVWLPAWLVQAALLGHVLVFRALRQPGAARPPASG